MGRSKAAIRLNEQITFVQANFNPKGTLARTDETFWASMDDGRWYAIPPSIVERLQKAGATIQLSPFAPQ